MTIESKGTRGWDPGYSRNYPQQSAAVLGVMIGVAVQCLMDVVGGAGIGANTMQWKLWANGAVRMAHGGVAHDEEYYLQDEGDIKLTSLGDLQQVFHTNKFHLLLHNDDIYTFEKVIEAFA